MFGEELAVATGSDLPDADVLPAVIDILFVEPDRRAVDATRALDKEKRIEIDDKGGIADKVPQVVGRVPINRYHADSHA